MSNEKFNSLLEEFKENFKLVSNANDLPDLKEKYVSLEISRENVFDWIISNIQEDEQKGEYFSRFGQFENSLWQGNSSQELVVGIPIFGSFDNICSPNSLVVT
jgi:hypothetical protein